MRATPRTARQAFSEKNIPVKFERPRARRYPFVASIELTDLAIRDAHQRTDERLKFVWLSCEHRGGPADTGNGHAEDIHAGANLWLFGTFAYALDYVRMGIAFGD